MLGLVCAKGSKDSKSGKAQVQVRRPRFFCVPQWTCFYQLFLAGSLARNSRRFIGQSDRVRAGEGSEADAA